MLGTRERVVSSFSHGVPRVSEESYDSASLKGQIQGAVYRPALTTQA